MVYSYEEVYFELGQYDRFCHVYFHAGTESEAMIGKNNIMGTFKFTDREIEALEKLRDTKTLPRTQARVKFVPSELEKLNEGAMTFLDRDGFECSDIATVWKRDNPKENRYTKTGIKERPHVIPIRFDPTGFDYHFAYLRLFENWRKRGCTFPDFKWDIYFALLLYYDSDKVSEDKVIYSNFEKKILRDNIRREYLNIRKEKNELSDDEFQELLKLMEPVMSERKELFTRELQRSSNNLKDVYRDYPDQIRRLIMVTVNFENEVLHHGDPSIWWDFERFLHIYMRHVKDVQLGANFATKGVFQYRFKEVKEVIKDVVESVYEDIVEHFKAYPDRTFNRMGSRAINYDGNFYRIEIEPGGRLLAYHPYRTLVEAEADKEPE